MTTRFGYSLEELTHLSIFVRMPVVYYGEMIQSKISREKVHGVKSRGSQVQASENPRPMGVLNSSSIKSRQLV